MKLVAVLVALSWAMLLVAHADDDFPADEFTVKETKSAASSPSAVSNAKPQKPKSTRKCWKCHGKGYEVKNVAETCDRCGGCKITEEPKEVEKTTWVKDWYGHLRPETRKVTVVNKQPCQQCRRTGRVYVKKEVECSACKGTGHQ